MDLYEACGGARTPLRDAVEAVDPMAALSPREVQVCRLALEPEATNAEIATRLGVAELTIANHLARAYRKLGVAGRDELFPVLTGAPNR